MENKELVEFEYRPIDEISNKGELIGKLGYKANSSIYVVGAVGVALIVVLHNLFGIVFGLFCVAMAAVNYYSVKEHDVLHAYSNGILFLKTTDLSQGVFVPKNMIKYYSVNAKNDNVVEVRLIDERSFQTESFQTSQANKLFKKALPGRSKADIVIAENKKLAEKKKRKK